MSSISSVGIGSGVLTSDLIDDLIEAERSSTDNRLAAEETSYSTKITELGNLSSAADKLQSAVSSLTYASSFESNTTSSGNESALTATASSFAKPGIYTVETLALASSQAIASKEYSSLTDIVGQGKLVFDFGDIDTSVNSDKSISSFDSFTQNDDVASRTINITSANHTLSDLRDTINNADIGITASIVDTGSGFRLLFESTDSGDNNGFTITANDAANGLDDLNFNATDHDQVLHTVDASDSSIKVNGLTISRESNLVTGVINGVTLNLKETTVNEAVALTIQADTSTISARVEDFVSAYNELKELSISLTAYDTESGEGSVFTGDVTLRSLDTHLKRILSSSLSNSVGSDVTSLAQVGITSSDSGNLSFDSSTFSAYVQSSPESLTKLFGTTGNGATNVEYLNGQVNTQAGDYDVVVSKLATQAKLLGNANASSSFIINQNNDGFAIKIDGRQSATIDLANGAYTGEQLASLLEQEINSDETIKDGAVSVSVVFDSSNNSFSLESASFGSTSSIAFSSMDSEFAQTLGLALPGQGPRALDTVAGLTSTTALASAITIDNTNNSFALTVAGVSTDSLELASGSYSDGADLARAIQAAINSDVNFIGKSISSSVTYQADQDGGQFEVRFNKDQIYTINSTDAGFAAVTGISPNLASSEKVDALKVADTFAAAVTVDDNNDSFGIQIGAIGGKPFADVTIAQGSYASGAALATAVQDALNAKTNIDDPAIIAGSGIDLSSGIDFAAAPKALALALNGGAETLVHINQNATTDLNGDSTVDAQDNIFAIQAAIDSAFGAGNISASIIDDKLALTTVAAGASASLQVAGDGFQATTGAGTTVVSDSENFTALSNASIDFSLNSNAVSVDLSDIDLSAPGSQTLLEAVQSKLDAALSGAGGLNAGEIVAKQDSSNNIYFVSQSRGSNESLTITAVGSDDVLGLAAAVGTANEGIDGIGINTQIASGRAAQEATVSYVGGTGGGALKIDYGNGETFNIFASDGTSASTLGIKVDDGSQSQAVTGSNVEGTINGVAGEGSGQRLIGAVGNAAEGLSVTISGDSIGNRGAVNYNLGLAEQLMQFLEQVLGSGGSITEKQSGLQSSLEAISVEKADLEVRMEDRRASLSSQFTYYDTIVSQLNNTADFLQANFDAWNSVRNQ